MECPTVELPTPAPTVSEILLLRKLPSTLRHRNDDADIQHVHSQSEPPQLKEGVISAVLSPVPSIVTLALPVVATFRFPKVLADWGATDHA